MKRFSIEKFTKKTLEQHGSGEAEAGMLILLDGEKITVSSIGTDPLFINDHSVALAGTLHTLLDRQFAISSAIYNGLKQKGRIKAEISEQICKAPEEEFYSGSAERKREHEPESPQEDIFIRLAALLEKELDLGGRSNAHDD